MRKSSNGLIVATMFRSLSLVLVMTLPMCACSSKGVRGEPETVGALDWYLSGFDGEKRYTGSWGMGVSSGHGPAPKMVSGPILDNTFLGIPYEIENADGTELLAFLLVLIRDLDDERYVSAIRLLHKHYETPPTITVAPFRDASARESMHQRLVKWYHKVKGKLVWDPVSLKFLVVSD